MSPREEDNVEFLEDVAIRDVEVVFQGTDLQVFPQLKDPLFSSTKQAPSLAG